jgi:transposase
MPTEGVSMRKIKTILRLYHESKLSQHQIANSLQLSVGVVNKYLKLAANARIKWPLPTEYNDEEVLRKLLRQGPLKLVAPLNPIDFAHIHQELKRKSVTLQLLWEEYKPTVARPLSYSQFCRQYRYWKKTQPSSMRQTHKAGDKAFVDYAGQTIDILDLDTMEVRTAQIFVGILGASNYTFAEATWSQQLPDWIASHRRMLEFFGGVPALIVPDNLKSGITKACRYEPDVNPTYADFIEYYGTAVLPARPKKPKDKPKVENAVLVVERWILARIRNLTFAGLADLNQTIHKLLLDLNTRQFKKLPGSRLSAFEAIDKPALKPLPMHPYEYTHYKKSRVHIDYHVELEQHYYSVPYQFIGKEIGLRYTGERIECWHQGEQIALHVRSNRKGSHTTLADHMPKSHRKHMEWTPGRFLNWAIQIGAATTCFVKHLLEHRPHPEQGYRSCLGLLNLSKRFGDARLEKACERAWLLGARSRRSVDSILKYNLENAPLSSDKEIISTPFIQHENLRGKKNYH